MKKSLEDIIKAAQTEPVQIPFEVAVTTAKQRLAVLSLQSLRLGHIRTFLVGVIVGILLASLSFGYFLRGNTIIIWDKPDKPQPTVAISTPEHGVSEKFQRPTGDSEKVAFSNVRNQAVPTLVHYITGYLLQPGLSDFFRQPSWNEIAYSWSKTLDVATNETITPIEPKTSPEDQLPKQLQEEATIIIDSNSHLKDISPISQKSQTEQALSFPFSTNLALNLYSYSDGAITSPTFSPLIEKTFLKTEKTATESSFGNIISVNKSVFQERFAIGMRGITTLYAPKPTNPSIMPDRYILENAVMYGSYALFKNTAVGLEAGYDTYYQRFRTYDADRNTEFDNEQYPTLWWLAAFIRQRISFSDQFAVILQGALGWTLTGPTGRSIIGLSFQPDARTEITVGLEGSSVMFPELNTYRISSKIGLTYGVSVKF